MAKKDKNKRTEKNTSDYYKLKTGAVNKLVDTSNAPVVPESELRKYKSKGKINIPDWLKVVFIKFWFGGAACYFFLWGLGMYLADLELMIVISIGLGLVTDLMVNHLLHFIAPEKGYYDKWMMFPYKKFWTIFLNCVYAGIILFFVMYTYQMINLVANNIMNSDEKTIVLGVEPLLFGTFFMVYDLLFVGIKNLIKKIFIDANKRASKIK